MDDGWQGPRNLGWKAPPLQKWALAPHQHLILLFRSASCGSYRYPVIAALIVRCSAVDFSRAAGEVEGGGDRALVHALPSTLGDPSAVSCQCRSDKRERPSDSTLTGIALPFFSSRRPQLSIRTEHQKFPLAALRAQRTGTEDVLFPTPATSSSPLPIPGHSLTVFKSRRVTPSDSTSVSTYSCFHHHLLLPRSNPSPLLVT